MVREFVEGKRTGKRQDVTTEQKEYERAKKELRFKPDIAKSQLSHNRQKTSSLYAKATKSPRSAGSGSSNNQTPRRSNMPGASPSNLMMFH